MAKITFEVSLSATKAEDALLARIKNARTKIIALKKQAGIHSRIRPLRATIKRNLESAKNSKDENALKRLKIERRVAQERIARLEKELTTKSSSKQLNEQIKRVSEQLNELNAKLREARAA